jgi:hypothetical protein
MCDPVLRSRSWSPKEPLHFGGAGAGTLCGSGSQLDVQHRGNIIENITDCHSFSPVPFSFFKLQFQSYKIRRINRSSPDVEDLFALKKS